jgi:hypothetical protein
VGRAREKSDKQLSQTFAGLRTYLYYRSHGGSETHHGGSWPIWGPLWGGRMQSEQRGEHRSRYLPDREVYWAVADARNTERGLLPLSTVRRTIPNSNYNPNRGFIGLNGGASVCRLKSNRSLHEPIDFGTPLTYTGVPSAPRKAAENLGSCAGSGVSLPLRQPVKKPNARVNFDLFDLDLSKSVSKGAPGMVRARSGSYLHQRGEIYY